MTTPIETDNDVGRGYGDRLMSFNMINQSAMIRESEIDVPVYYEQQRFESLPKIKPE